MTDTTQRTPEWHAERLGRVTASRISDVMMAPTTAGYRGYLAQLVCERLTGTPTETFKSAAMQHGMDTEADARAAYSARKGVIVDETGFHKHPDLEAGASPDGLVETDGLVEIKSVQPQTFLDLIDSRKVPADHALQIQWQLAVTGRDWCDYAVYCSKLPPHLQLLIIRVERNQAKIIEITERVTGFLNEVTNRVNRLREMTP